LPRVAPSELRNVTEAARAGVARVAAGATQRHHDSFKPDIASLFNLAQKLLGRRRPAAPVTYEYDY
jgi:hypothetical protein